MDDFIIQEEITVKTEPNSGFDHPKDDMIFMKFVPDANGLPNKLDLVAEKDSDFLFLDPDTPIGHYEEVLDGPVDVENASISFGDSDKRSKSPPHYDQTDLFGADFSDAAMEEAVKYQTGFMLECSFCKFTTAIEKVMKNHMLHHIDKLDLDALVEESRTEDGILQCLFCTFSNDCPESFKQHLQFKHMPPPKDPLPANIFESDDEELQRQLIVPLDCRYCDFHCTAIEDMNDHLPKHHPEKILKCSECSFCTFNKSVYKSHVDSHGRSFSCPKCRFTSTSKEELALHKSTHAPKSLTCTECGHTTKTRKSMLKHKEKHARRTHSFVRVVPKSEDGLLACDECSFVARTIQGFNKHKAKHFRKSRNIPEAPVRKTEEDLYPCQLCDFEARTLQGYNKHAEKHERLSGNFPKQFVTTAEEVYQCDVCSFSARTLQGFNKHRGKHLRQSLSSQKKNDSEHFPCLECSFVAKTLQGYNKHRAKHEERPTRTTYIKTEHDTFLCDECNFEAKTLQGYNKHKDKHYRRSVQSPDLTTLQPHFECSECGFTTRVKQSFLKHQLRHRDSDSSSPQKLLKTPDVYTCNDCSFKSETFVNFLKHKRKMQCSNSSPRKKKVNSRRGKTRKQSVKEFPFECSHCTYKAVKRSHLARHEMIHTGEKPYVCPHCDYCCNQASTLKVHIRRHTGESPFACSMCPFKTFASNSLTAHVRKHSANSQVECHVCHQLYQSETALKHHLKTHMDKRRSRRTLAAAVAAAAAEPIDVVNEPATLPGSYQCSVCDFQCSKFIELSEHTLQHKSEEKYACRECDLSFGRKKEIKAHFKDVHPGQTYKAR